MVSTKPGPVNPVDRRARLRSTIDSLLERRQRVLVGYCKIADEKNTADVETTAEDFRTFCQTLIDYTALGHFEIYQRIIEGKERRTAVKEVADQVYPNIAKTTDFLIDFNDKYDAFVASGDQISMFENELSQLGEVIGERVELEDRLLAALIS